MKKILLLLLFVPLVSFGQSQIVNGIEINAPKGFVKTGDLNWSDGNDKVFIQYVKGNLANDLEVFKDWCSKGTRTTKYVDFLEDEVQINGKTYPVCMQIGDNDLFMSMVFVSRDGYTYTIYSGTYIGDYEESEIDQGKHIERVGYITGYMINRINLF